MPRPSPIRDAVQRLMRRKNVHAVSLAELHERLTQAGTQADFSSVYRAVAHLEAERELQRVELGDGVPRYEAATAHHEHIRCVDCGKIEAIFDCLIEGRKRIAAGTGFTVLSHALVLSGRCLQCGSGAS